MTWSCGRPTARNGGEQNFPDAGTTKRNDRNLMAIAKNIFNGSSATYNDTHMNIGTRDSGESVSRTGSPGADGIVVLTSAARSEDIPSCPRYSYIEGRHKGSYFPPDAGFLHCTRTTGWRQNQVSRRHHPGERVEAVPALGMALKVHGLRSTPWILLVPFAVRHLCFNDVLHTTRADSRLNRAPRRCTTGRSFRRPPLANLVGRTLHLWLCSAPWHRPLMVISHLLIGAPLCLLWYTTWHQSGAARAPEAWGWASGLAGGPVVWGEGIVSTGIHVVPLQFGQDSERNTEGNNQMSVRYVVHS